MAHEALSSGAIRPQNPLAVGMPIRKVLIKGGAVKLTVIADPTVALAIAEGEHRIERSDDILVVHAGSGPQSQSIDMPQSRFRNWLDQVMGPGESRLVVRVNPDLPLAVTVAGGKLKVDGMRAGANIDLKYGMAKLNNGTGPLVLDVLAGSAKADWVFTGESRIRVDMGEAKVSARPESNVTISTEVNLGEIKVTTDSGTVSTNEGTVGAIKVGNGDGSLLVHSRLGSAHVSVGTVT